MDHVIGEAAAQGFSDDPDPAVIHTVQLLLKLRRRKSGIVIRKEAVHVLLQGTDGLHKAALKAGADTHDLAGGLHLGSQTVAGVDEFIKGKTRHLHDYIVQHGLKAGVGFFRYGIFDLV